MTVARHTGPDLGLVDIGETSENWQFPNQRFAYGHSTSLYDRNPFTGVRAGDPIADCFAISAQENNCILIIADGVNWGPKAQLAARCAVYASMDLLLRELFQSKVKTTKVRRRKTSMCFSMTRKFVRIFLKRFECRSMQHND